MLVVASTSLHPALRAGPTLAELQRAATGGDGGAPTINDDLALQQPVAHLRGLGEARLDPARPTGSGDPKPPGLAAAAPVLAHAPRAPPQVHPVPVRLAAGIHQSPRLSTGPPSNRG